MVNKGFVIPIIIPTILNKNKRTTNAKTIPIFRANLFFSAGSLSVTIDIKMILSIPKTISKSDNTTK